MLYLISCFDGKSFIFYNKKTGIRNTYENSFLNKIYRKCCYRSYDRALDRLEKLKIAFPDCTFEILGLSDALFSGNKFLLKKEMF